MQTITETVRSDALHVVEPRAALDVYKLQITASIRLCDADGGPPASAMLEFGTTPAGLRAKTGWLLENGVEAASLERTSIFWEAPYVACEEAGILPTLLHTQQVRKCDPQYKASHPAWHRPCGVQSTAHSKACAYSDEKYRCSERHR